MHIILVKRGAINIIFTSKYLLNHKYDIIVEGSSDPKNFPSRACEADYTYIHPHFEHLTIAYPCLARVPIKYQTF